MQEKKIKSAWILGMPLSRLTTIGVGGLCSVYILVRSVADLMEILKEIRKKRLRYKVIGNGSNLLFDDSGFKGIILKLTGKSFQAIKDLPGELVCGAGISSQKLLRFCMQKKIGGLEFLTGIPGTLGGMIRMNAGAFSQDIGGRVKRLRVLIPPSKLAWIKSASLRFEYRKLKGLPQGAIILQAALRKKASSRQSISEKVNFFRIEREKRRPKGKTFGSVFKNPEGLHAWEVIERIGLRGYRSGGACLSTCHPNWIVNSGHASSRDILRIIKIVKRKAKEKLNIDLETEVEYVENRKVRK